MRLLILAVIALAATITAACSPPEDVEAADAVVTAEPAPLLEPLGAPDDLVVQEPAAEIEPLPPRPRPRRQDMAEAGPMTADQMQTRALRGFQRADTDEDGVITTAEIERAVEAGQTGVRGWSRADRDRDGRLTQQEFQSVVAWRFQRVDTDEDGSVSAAERQAARQPAD